MLWVADLKLLTVNRNKYEHDILLLLLVVVVVVGVVVVVFSDRVAGHQF